MVVIGGMAWQATWARRVGGGKSDYATSVVVSSSTGDIFVAGRWSSSSITVDGTTYSNLGSSTSEGFVVRGSSII